MWTGPPGNARHSLAALWEGAREGHGDAREDAACKARLDHVGKGDGVAVGADEGPATEGAAAAQDLASRSGAEGVRAGWCCGPMCAELQGTACGMGVATAQVVRGWWKLDMKGGST